MKLAVIADVFAEMVNQLQPGRNRIVGAAAVIIVQPEAGEHEFGVFAAQENAGRLAPAVLLGPHAELFQQLQHLDEAEQEKQRILADAKRAALAEKNKVLQEANAQIEEMVSAAVDKLLVPAGSAYDSFDSAESDDSGKE